MKNKDYAIHCNNGNNIYFGGGHDFYVYNDFKTVGSNLGVSYDITGYNV